MPAETVWLTRSGNEGIAESTRPSHNLTFPLVSQIRLRGVQLVIKHMLQSICKMAINTRGTGWLAASLCATRSVLETPNRNVSVGAKLICLTTLQSRITMRCAHVICIICAWLILISRVLLHVEQMSFPFHLSDVNVHYEQAGKGGRFFAAGKSF